MLQFPCVAAGHDILDVIILVQLIDLVYISFNFSLIISFFLFPPAATQFFFLSFPLAYSPLHS